MNARMTMAAVFMGLLGHTWPVPAQAEPEVADECKTDVPDVEQQDKARQLLDEADALQNEQRSEEAFLKYVEALEHWERMDIHLQAGIWAFNTLRLLESYKHLSLVVRCGRGELTEDDLVNAGEKLDRVRQRLSELEVQVDEPGARVFLDNALWFTARKAGDRDSRPLVAGAHVLRVEKPGYVPVFDSVVLEEGKKAIYEPTVMSEREATIIERRFSKPLPWIIAGVGAASLASGLGLRSYAQRSMDRYEAALVEKCGAGCERQDLAGLEGDREWAGAMDAVGWTALAAGGVALVAGVTMAFLNQPTTRRHEDAGKLRRIEVQPLLAPNGAVDGAQVLVGGRF